MSYAHLGNNVSSLICADKTGHAVMNAVHIGLDWLYQLAAGSGQGTHNNIGYDNMSFYAHSWLYSTFNHYM